MLFSLGHSYELLKLFLKELWQNHHDTYHAIYGIVGVIVLLIIYLSFIEVFKIGKLLKENLNTEFDISRKWASQNYSILKKRLAERKVAGVIEN